MHFFKDTFVSIFPILDYCINNQYITVEPSELIFDSNNYNAPQTVTINSSKDNNEIEDTAIIKINSSNISEKQLNVTIADKGPEGTPAEN